MSAQIKVQPTCTCGNPVCAVRAARGLTPFCQIPPPPDRAPAGYSSREACLAAHPGHDVYGRSIGGMGHGMRWYPVAGRVAA